MMDLPTHTDGGQRQKIDKFLRTGQAGFRRKMQITTDSGTFLRLEAAEVAPELLPPTVLPYP